jgi:hypothetical protein
MASSGCTSFVDDSVSAGRDVHALISWGIISTGRIATAFAKVCPMVYNLITSNESLLIDSVVSYRIC